jgi:hypothetical protein
VEAERTLWETSAGQKKKMERPALNRGEITGRFMEETSRKLYC